MPAAYATLALDGRKIDNNLRAIGKNSKALDQLIHTTGVAIIIQSLPMDMGGHLDCSKALKFVQNLSAGTSRNRVVQWLHDFSNIRVTYSDENKAWSAKLIKPGQAGYITPDPVAANKTPFWEHSREGAAITAAMDDTAFARRLAALLKAVDTARTENRLTLTPATLALVDRLKRDQETVAKRAEGMASKVGHKVMATPPKAAKKVPIAQLRVEAGLDAAPQQMAAAG